MEEQGVITNLFLALIKLLADGLYALLPDLDLDTYLATYNTTMSMDGINAQGISYVDASPWEIVLHWLATFNMFMPISEAYQIIAFGLMGYVAMWGVFFGGKAIKYIRGSG